MYKKLLFFPLLCIAPSLLTMERSDKELNNLFGDLYYRENVDPELVRRYLKYGVDVNEADAAEGMTGLHHAAANGHKEVCEVLLDNGANACTFDDFGQLPLHYAVGMCYRPIKGNTETYIKVSKLLFKALKHSVFLMPRNERIVAKKRFLTMCLIRKFGKISSIPIVGNILGYILPEGVNQRLEKPSPVSLVESKDLFRMILAYDNDYCPVILYECIQGGRVPAQYRSLISKEFLESLKERLERVIMSKDRIRPFNEKLEKMCSDEFDVLKAHLKGIVALFSSFEETQEQDESEHSNY